MSHLQQEKKMEENLKIHKTDENTFYVFSEQGLNNKKTGFAEWSWGPFKTIDIAKKEINNIMNKYE